MKLVIKYTIIILFSLLLILVLDTFFPYFSFNSYKTQENLEISEDYKFKKKYKIQITPVLNFIGDMKAAHNLCISANNLGLECQIFARQRDIYNIKNFLD